MFPGAAYRPCTPSPGDLPTLARLLKEMPQLSSFVAALRAAKLSSLPVAAVTGGRGLVAMLEWQRSAVPQWTQILLHAMHSEQTIECRAPAAAVLAPNNAAFLRAQQAGLLPVLPLNKSTTAPTELSPEAVNALQRFLLDSLVPGKLALQELSAQTEVTTASGARLRVAAAPGEVLLFLKA